MRCQLLCNELCNELTITKNALYKHVRWHVGVLTKVQSEEKIV